MGHEKDNNFRSNTHQQLGTEGFWGIRRSSPLVHSMDSPSILKGHRGRENWVEMHVL